jgi:hypothetical protein
LQHSVEVTFVIRNNNPITYHSHHSAHTLDSTCLTGQTGTVSYVCPDSGFVITHTCRG